MNQEDYPSDSDASDEDFRPDKEEQDTGSELESEEDEAPETNDESKGTKRKKKVSKVGMKKAKSSIKTSNESSEENGEELDEEEEKRKTDALWASFLGGSTVGSKPNESATSTKSKSCSSTGNSSSKLGTKAKLPVKTSPVVDSTKPLEKEKLTVEQLFEFAGEQVVLNEEASKQDVVNNEKTASSAPLAAVPRTSSSGFPRRVGSGGLGAVLNQINKKNKLTTLEKTKLDWTSFKQQEGISEELQTHNKGKDGFLERRDFLERTDLRQFEIEKSFRQTKRSNR